MQFQKISFTLSFISLVALTGCSSMLPGRYTVSPDNVEILKKIKGQSRITNITTNYQFDTMCRLLGNIEPPDGLTYPKFIEKSFNDELRAANLYGDEGTHITGEISKLSFSSSENFSQGFWEIGLALRASNGKRLNVTNRYNFKAGFEGISACSNVAQSLTPAVQDLIKGVITQPTFSEMLIKTP